MNHESFLSISKSRTPHSFAIFKKHVVFTVGL